MSDVEIYTGTKLSDFQRGHIKALYGLEQSVKDIAQRMAQHNI